MLFEGTRFESAKRAMLGSEAGTIALPLRTPLSHAAGATGDGDDTGTGTEVEVELVIDVVDFEL